MEFLRSFLRRHFAGKPVVTSRNVGSLFLRLNWVIYEWKFHTALDAVIMAQRLCVSLTEINVQRCRSKGDYWPQQCTQNLLARREWGKKKPPLKLHYRLSFLPGYRKLEWTLAYRSCGTKERERLRWTPPYANSNQLNGVGGDETSLIWGRRERAGRINFPCFPWLVRILPAGLCIGDREIRLANLGGGGQKQVN